MQHPDDITYMRYALALARRGIGRTAPNPSVGCVIVNDGLVVGTGNTADGGRPHAETIALTMAGEKAAGATAYVSLEPCSHHGKTPPCALGLIEAGIARCVIACGDTNPQINGAGIKMLREAGIEVLSGVCEREAVELNMGFFLVHEVGRPFITLKTAMTIDGKVALGNGQSQWITNPLSRRKAHQIRSQHDAVLCGIGTVNVDDPRLNTRVDGLVHKSVRIVLDTKLSIDVNARMVQSAPDEPLWIIHDTSDAVKIEALELAGAKTFKCNTRDLYQVLQLISENGMTRLLVEGGGEIHTSFLREGLWDEMTIFTGTKVFGAGHSVFRDMNFEKVDETLQFERFKTILLGQDKLDYYKKCSQD